MIEKKSVELARQTLRNIANTDKLSDADIWLLAFVCSLIIKELIWKNE
jgi:hypothetical protein